MTREELKKQAILLEDHELIEARLGPARIGEIRHVIGWALRALPVVEAVRKASTARNTQEAVMLIADAWEDYEKEEA